ncbi:hypothetical protein [Cohnella herbarum]|uniref:Uncharacterized protein n=1 Tax=Cohnella herbarum TaxID=2728023 RepID=A0A7Z2VH35_9BACL|nr:hypothetical protein [Cohnella herbarum]QJD82921.1 hypothetical protein HH215_06845 [Cohnella herbarum]
MKLIKPVFEILQDQKEIFENHWNLRSEAYELLSEEDIKDILIFTKQKLIELKNYIGTVKENKKTMECLYFYKDHVDLLLRYHLRKFDGYPGTYMYIYSELLLGAERYLNIKNELRRLGCIIEEDRSIT